MMKKMSLLSKQLDIAFSLYKHQSKAAKRRATLESVNSESTAKTVRQLMASGLASRVSSTLNLMTGGQTQIQMPLRKDQTQDEEGVVELDASDLMAFLNISREEAEEMVFLADQDDDVNCHRSSQKPELTVPVDFLANIVIPDLHS